MTFLVKVPVSVVIPCFRCALTIERAVQSIIDQTQKPAEVILVDDASGDETLAVLLEIEQQYPNWIKVLELGNNQGAASARNAGWAIATQPYIALLDSDDAWHPQKIEIQYAYMKAHPEVVLCGHDYYFSDETLPRLLLYDTRSIGKNRLLLSNPFVTPSVMIRSSILFRFMPGQRYVDDHLLWMQIAQADLKVVKLMSPLVKIYKGLYGESGLSSHLWAMEKSELHNYLYLYKNKQIGLIVMLFLELFSIAKFMRRLGIVGINKACFGLKRIFDGFHG